ncbi:uncharacterized protein LOC143460803 [Clavelina lepadiformis]|uniref:uncharacterized protein LOC143460803 n=1 Tax=Clavelina lepadiformis TaxID=159417 RepID=UPI0040439414
MKVICAGLSKTGTKSMQAALKELGYNVYDTMDNYEHFRDDWIKILTKGGNSEDFRRMYQDIDAVADVPASAFWDEIHEAFPDSKIILTTRDEDDWIESWTNQMVKSAHPLILLGIYLSPTLVKLRWFWKQTVLAIFGGQNYVKGNKAGTNQLLYRMKYRRHNAHVLQNAPKDKLLVFNIKDGWGPLCQFLGLQVPSKPFPRKNVRGKIIEELMASQPTFVRVQREVKVSLALLLGFLGFGIFKICNSAPST